MNEFQKSIFLMLLVMRMVDQLVSCTDENVDSWHVCSGLDQVRLLDMVDELVAHICYNMLKDPTSQYYIRKNRAMDAVEFLVLHACVYLTPKRCSATVSEHHVNKQHA